MSVTVTLSYPYTDHLNMLKCAKTQEKGKNSRKNKEGKTEGRKLALKGHISFLPSFPTFFLNEFFPFSICVPISITVIPHYFHTKQ